MPLLPRVLGLFLELRMAVDGLDAKNVGNEAPSANLENYQYSRKVDTAVLGLTNLGFRGH